MAKSDIMPDIGLHFLLISNLRKGVSGKTGMYISKGVALWCMDMDNDTDMGHRHGQDHRKINF